MNYSTDPILIIRLHTYFLLPVLPQAASYSASGSEAASSGAPVLFLFPPASDPAGGPSDRFLLSLAIATSAPEDGKLLNKPGAETSAGKVSGGIDLCVDSQGWVIGVSLLFALFHPFALDVLPQRLHALHHLWPQAQEVQERPLHRHLNNP